MSVILGKGSVVESRGRRERAAADTSSGTSGTGTPGGSPRIFAGEHAGSVARGRTGERETRGLFLSLSLGQSPLCHRENSYGRPFIRPARTRSRLRRFRPPFNPGRTAAVIAPPPPDPRSRRHDGIETTDIPRARISLAGLADPRVLARSRRQSFPRRGDAFRSPECRGRRRI